MVVLAVMMAAKRPLCFFLLFLTVSFLLACFAFLEQQRQCIVNNRCALSTQLPWPSSQWSVNFVTYCLCVYEELHLSVLFLFVKKLKGM